MSNVVGRYLFKLMMNKLDLSFRGPRFAFMFIFLVRNIQEYKTKNYSHVTRASIYVQMIKNQPLSKVQNNNIHKNVGLVLGFITVKPL